jgi:methyltransferase
VISAPVAVLAIITLQRLVELWVSNINTGKLVARGAQEAGRAHYPLVVGLHIAWLAALWWLAPGREINNALLLAFAVLQLCRLWVIITLGQRWTTRIIVLPGAPLVRTGPYRFLPHPNYVVVAAEIALLPLVFGLWWIALVFSVLNAAMLTVRIREENKALNDVPIAPSPNRAA